MALTIPLDSAAAERLLGDLGRSFAQFPSEMEKVIVRALNRTLKGASTQAVRLITGRYRVKAGEVKRKISERRASRGRLFIQLVVVGRPILLSRFGAKRRDVKGKRGAYTYERGGKTISVSEGRPRKYRGATVQVLKTGRRKLVEGGFLGAPANGVEMIFSRGGTGPKALEVLRGPSLVSFLNQPKVEKLMDMTARERLGRELQHEAEFRLSQLVK